MLNNKLLAKKLVYSAMNHKKTKELKRRRKLRKRQKKERMIRLFGKTRYYLSWWLGQWILFAFNFRRQKEVEEPTQQPLSTKIKYRTAR